MTKYYVDKRAAKGKAGELIYIYDDRECVANNDLVLARVRKWLLDANSNNNSAKQVVRGTLYIINGIKLAEEVSKDHKTTLLAALQPIAERFLNGITLFPYTQKDELRDTLHGVLLQMNDQLENNMTIKKHLLSPENEHFITRIIELNSARGVTKEELLAYIKETDMAKLLGVVYCPTTTAPSLKIILPKAHQALEQIKFSKLCASLKTQINTLASELEADKSAGRLDAEFIARTPKIVVAECKLNSDNIKDIQNFHLMNKKDIAAFLQKYDAVRYEENGHKQVIINNPKHIKLVKEIERAAQYN